MLDLSLVVLPIVESNWFQEHAYGEKSQKVDTDWQVALANGYTIFSDSLIQLAIWDNLQIKVKKS